MSTNSDTETQRSSSTFLALASDEVLTEADRAIIVPSQPRSACTPSRNLTER